jgi:surface protein
MSIIAASRLRASVNTNAFIIEVDTSKTGVSNNNQFQFTGAERDYDVVAKQNDIVVATFNDLSGEETITLPSSGIYILEITPKAINGFRKIAFSNRGDKLKITDIKQWGNIVWFSLSKSFFGCRNLLVTATDYPDLSICTSLQQIFQDAIIANPNTSNWNVSNISNMSNCFNNSAFNQYVSNWDVSNVTTMAGLFNEASSFNQPLNNWDVSNVTSMGSMFNGASSFNQPLNNWNVSNVTNMSGMFDSASSFNQPLDNWNVSNVTNMSGMFKDATSFNRDLSGWCVEQISSRPSVFDSGTSSWYLPNARPNWGATC